MTIEELEDKHEDLEIEGNCEWNLTYSKHTKLSIEFTISVLEDFIYKKRHTSTFEMTGDILNKIQELKTYLE